MLIILTICLVIASVFILCIKKTKESIYLFGLCLSLMFEICGVMIFIAKKGGISLEVIQFLYISKDIQTKIQYFFITFNKLGYLIALGRTLFPFFLVELAMQYSMISCIRKNHWIMKAVGILPAVTLVVYYPHIYRMLVADNISIQKIVTYGTSLWITAYLLIAVLLLLYEFKSITMKFCRRQFIQIMVSMFALSGIYYLYYRQDSGQVYQFYSYSFSWNKGIGYMQVDPSLFSYFTLVIVSAICCILGFYSLIRFTSGNHVELKEDAVMERKFNTAKVGASMFVHSMKNQLLSSRVVYKRIGQLYEQPEVDVVKLKEYVDTLEELNNAMFVRMEELYRCVKSNAITMVPTKMDEIVDDALERFHKKYPEAVVQVEILDETLVLVDKTNICEALYNLLINAREAVLEADRGSQGEVTLVCHNERLYTVIEVRDNGSGMDKKQIKRIFDPFYSSKNANFNWGMGLYYVREIVKSHLGFMRVESEIGVGSSFYIILPKYQ